MSELEQFVIMAKTQKRGACAAVIEQILAAPSIFTFGEFEKLDNVKFLDAKKEKECNDREKKEAMDDKIKPPKYQSPYKPPLSEKEKASYRTLRLFAYDTYADYKRNSGNYLKLRPKQLAKLKQLSIVTLAGRSTTKILFYKDLQKALDIKTVRELEDLIIDCIYSGLIVGRLDQRKELLEIRYCRGRDIGPESQLQMKYRLKSWLKQTDEIIRMLQQQQKAAEDLTNKRNQAYMIAQAKIEQTTSEILEAAQKDQGGKGGHD